MNQKHLQYKSHVVADVNLMVENIPQDNDKCQYECKKPRTYSTCEKEYDWNPSTCDFKYKKVRLKGT